MLVLRDVCAAAGWARDGEDPVVWDIGLRLLGTDLGVGYRGFSLSPNVDTILWAYPGGGYEWLNYYREPSGALLAPGTLAGRDSFFERIEGQLQLGVEQGITWNPRTDTNGLAAFLFYRGRIDYNQLNPGDLLSATDLVDKNGLFLNTFLVGLTYNDELMDTNNKDYSGPHAEVSAEWGPSWFFNTVYGDSDFIRFNATARYFLPLYDAAPSSTSSVFSLYLGESLSVDYAIGIGAPVPVYIRQTFGGRTTEPVTGLGGAVRGVDNAAYDTNLKAVNSLEVRADLPSVILPNIVPGLVAFVDVGYYDQVGEPGIAHPGSGFVSSTGLGVFLDFLDLASGAAYMTYRLDGPNSDGTSFTPIVIEFGMHF